MQVTVRGNFYDICVNWNLIQEVMMNSVLGIRGEITKVALKKMEDFIREKAYFIKYRGTYISVSIYDQLVKLAKKQAGILIGITLNLKSIWELLP
jgi:hypothetical protein